MTSETTLVSTTWDASALSRDLPDARHFERMLHVHGLSRSGGTLHASRNPHKERTMNSMGMIQVEGLTYRVGYLGKSEYEIVRLLDDVRLGSFRSEGTRITSRSSPGEGSLVTFAQAAVRQGRTKWTPQAPASARLPHRRARGAIAEFFRLPHTALLES
jgi:hypothetical protein